MRILSYARTVILTPKFTCPLKVTLIVGWTGTLGSMGGPRPLRQSGSCASQNRQNFSSLQKQRLFAKRCRRPLDFKNQMHSPTVPAPDSQAWLTSICRICNSVCLDSSGCPSLQEAYLVPAECNCHLARHCLWTLRGQEHG